MHLTYASRYLNNDLDHELCFNNIEPRDIIKHIDEILDEIDIKNVNNKEHIKNTVKDCTIFNSLFKKALERISNGKLGLVLPFI